jgi:hypothetical protein
MFDFPPTQQQQHAIDLFETGESLVIEAGAGTGKTATLLQLGAATKRPGQYIAFNKAIVTEAKTKFPQHVRASTAHSLAFQAVGKHYAKRLNAPRMKSWRIAKVLGIKDIEIIDAFDVPMTLTAGYLAGVVNRAIGEFCRSGDPAFTERHFERLNGVDADVDGKRTWVKNDQVREYLLPAALDAWADLTDLSGILPYKHEHYLKLYQLSDPTIDAEFILFDEAQDANPVIDAIVRAQEHAQIVRVGDSQQSIYGFTGAVNALAKVDESVPRAFLTQSFRFGPAIADRANDVLAKIEYELRQQGDPMAKFVLRLTGNPDIESTVGPVGDPRAILTRTNAAAMSWLIAERQRGRRPHLVGGGTEVASFARAAAELQNEQRTYHPDLANFKTWGEVQEYVKLDSDGADLLMLVNLVDGFGAETLIAALGNMPSEDKADVTISTAHKSKGREWSTVLLADDFQKKVSDGEGGFLPPLPPTVDELRLLYVAVTRARQRLDDSSIVELLAA